jgi:hypothetical protein
MTVDYRKLAEAARRLAARQVNPYHKAGFEQDAEYYECKAREDEELEFARRQLELRRRLGSWDAVAEYEGE